MTKAEREALGSEIIYFQGIQSALRFGLFNGESAKNVSALQMVTSDKLQEAQDRLSEENKRIEQLIDLGGQDGTSFNSASAG